MDSGNKKVKKKKSIKEHFSKYHDQGAIEILKDRNIVKVFFCKTIWLFDIRADFDYVRFNV